MPPPPRPHWSTIDVGGHPCELHAPADPVAGRAIIFLHGLRGRWLRERTVLCTLFERHRLPVLAPRTGRSWWLDRIVPRFDPAVTAERHVLDAVRAEAGRRFAVPPTGIALVGTGMGGQGALRLAYRHPAAFPIAAAIAPAIDFHLALRTAHERDDGERYDTLAEVYGDVERARQDTALLHVHPLNWPRHQCFAADPADPLWFDGAARLHDKLGALGIPHTALLTLPTRPGPCYEDRVAPEIVDFVVAALDAESRRLA